MRLAMPLVFLAAALAAWTLYRSTHQHARRWRWPVPGALTGLACFMLAWFAATHFASVSVGFFLALSALMLMLTLVALVGGWRQLRAQR